MKWSARTRLTHGCSKIVAVFVIVILATLIAMSLGSWQQGVRGAYAQVRALSSVTRAVLDRRSSQGNGDFTNIIFLHHSTGGNLIRQGGVRERFSQAGYDFWDHGYNDEGLRRPDGSTAGYSYNVPGDNTNPDGLARVFSQPVYGLPLNALSGLLQHEVIAFKSCFPISHITSDEQLEIYRNYYLRIRDTMDRHLDRIFIVVTQPPLNPAATDAQAAARARVLANWLKSNEYLGGHPNVFTFDLFDHLAEGDPNARDHNMLKKPYRNGTDSHPNTMANQQVAPIFAGFIVEAIQTYRATRQATK